MRTRENFFYFLVTCVEAWHFLLPARKGLGAACTKVMALYQHFWAKRMQRLACPRAFTVQADRGKTTSESGGMGKQRQSVGNRVPVAVPLLAPYPNEGVSGIPSGDDSHLAFNITLLFP